MKPGASGATKRSNVATMRSSARSSPSGSSPFNQGIARLADDELARAAAVDKSAETVRTCEKKVEDAKALVHTARQNTAKIEAHKALWSEDLKKEAERAEEREFEDFKPVSRLGAEGEDS